MKGFILKGFTVFCSLLLLSSCFDNDSDVDLSKALVVGVSPDYPPFEFMKSQKVVGFDVDFVKAVGKVLNKKVIIKEYEFPAIMPALKANKINMGVSGFTKTLKREGNFSFSEIYYHNVFAVLQLLDSTPITMDNLKDKKIGAQIGSTMHQMLTELNGQDYNIEIMALNQNNQLVEDLKLKRIDGVLLEKSIAEAYVKKNPDMRFTVLNEVEMGYAVLLQKQSPLLPEINQAIEVLKANGTMEKLQKKWLDAND